MIQTQLEYAAFTIRKTKDSFAEIKDELCAEEAKVVQVYQEYTKVVSLDASRETFHHQFLHHLQEIAQAACAFYHTAKLSFIACVQYDLAVSTRHLESVHAAMSKVHDEPSHANKDVLVDTYELATADFAKLAESTSRKAIQPTTASELSMVLHSYFDKVNDLNDALADVINDVLQASGAQVRDAYPPALAALENLEHCIRDLNIIITEEHVRLSKIDLFPIFLNSLTEADETIRLDAGDAAAAAAAAAAAGAVDGEEGNPDDLSNLGKLNDYSARTGNAITPVQKALAKLSDELGMQWAV